MTVEVNSSFLLGPNGPKSLVGYEQQLVAIEPPQTASYPIESLPEQNLERIETKKGLFTTETVISSAAEHTLITVRRIKNGQGKVDIDSSIRIPAGENGSYILRHDSTYIEGYQDWELIKTITADTPNGYKNVEQTIFNRVSTDPIITLDDNIAPEWRTVLGKIIVLISSLPDYYPEKKVLEKDWSQVTIITSKQEQIALQNQEWFEEYVERTIDVLLSQQKQPNFIQKALEYLTTLIKNPRGYGSDRSQPQTRNLTDEHYYIR